MEVQEEWKLTHDDKYQVSSLGRVRNRKTMKYLKPKINNGYALVGFGGKAYRIHRLVANAFLSNPEGKTQVNHKQLPKTDNRLENLEWVTASENMRSFYGPEKGSISRQPLRFESDTDIVVVPSISAACSHFERCLGTLWGAVKNTDAKPNTRWRGYKISRITHEEYLQYQNQQETPLFT